jgi:hypothetical protein
MAMEVIESMAVSYSSHSDLDNTTSFVEQALGGASQMAGA